MFINTPTPIHIQIPINLPNDFLEVLSKEFSNLDSDKVNWIKTSLIHRSYLNENHNIALDESILRTLGGLGASFMDLMLFDIARENNPQGTVKDYDKFAHAVWNRILNEIFISFDLKKVIFVGKGEISSPKLESGIGKQFLGALVLCCGYDEVKRVISPIIQKLHESENHLDYKTILQEYSQSRKLGTPLYELVGESGLDHNKKFVIRVSTKDGINADAEGNSKHLASKKAAKAYIEQYIPDLLANKANSKQIIIITPANKLPSFHEDFVAKICQTFKVDKDKAWLFSQALTHASFVNEYPVPLTNNKKLAQIGSKVLEAIFTEKIVNQIFEGHFLHIINTVEGYKAFLNEDSNLLKGAELFKLSDGILLGRGEKNDIKTKVSNQVETFQAFIGAAFICHETWGNFTKNLPAQFLDWLNQILDDLLLIERKYIDPVSEIQEILQGLKLEWDYKFQSNYKIQPIDLGLICKYGSELIIYSSIINEKFIFTDNASFTTKREAAKHVASIAVETINFANSKIDHITLTQFLNKNQFEEFCRFLITHELLIQLSQKETIRWYNLGILGSKLLLKGNLLDFKIWAIAVGNILQKNQRELPSLENLPRFYSKIPIVSNIQNDMYNKEIKNIISFVEALDPQDISLNVKNSDEFNKVLNLSKIYKLLSQNWVSVNLSEIINDFILLRQGKSPEIVANKNFTETTLLEREGTYQTILSEIMLLIEQDIKLNGYAVRVNFEFDNTTPQSQLKIRFDTENALASFAELYEQINKSILWNHFREEIPIIKITVENSRIEISCLVHILDNSFATQALKVYKQQTVFSKNEYQVASQLLHDLKNQLIACQVSIDNPGKDRTSILRAKLNASQHLDNAILICHSLEPITNTMVSPKIEEINIGEYIRQYLAKKILSVPSNIRIETPKTIGDSIIYTSVDFITAIMENLTKNAVEAMPNGGEIRIDWLYDSVSELLLLGISDTGPGLDADILDKLNSGRSIASAKRKGSGIGLLSIASMVDRLGGTFTVNSYPGKGTHWNITLPSLSPKDELVKIDVSIIEEDQGV